MENGKLIITKGKSGIYAQILLENGKILNSIGYKPQDTIYDGKQIEFERVNGLIVKVICEGNTIFEKLNIQSSIGQNHSSQKQYESKNQVNVESQKNQQSMQKSNYSIPQYATPEGIYDIPLGTAQAPYNFIPLNYQIAEITELPLQNKYYDERERLTGYIQLHIESETPIYIRDSLDSEELKEQEEENQKNKRFIHSDFYSPNGKIAIPGSSMRGMVRSLVEITSFGHFGFYNNSRLYFRALADVTNLKKEYSDKMSAWDKRTKSSQYKMKAGILRMNSSFDFEIIPVGNFKEGFDSIPKFASKQILIELEKKDKEKYKYGTFRAYWIDSKQEYIVVSGDMGNKKRDWIVKSKPVPNEMTIRLTEKEIEDYMNDTNRMAINLIYELRKSKKFEYEIIKDKGKENESLESFTKDPKRYKALIIHLNSQWTIHGYDDKLEYKQYNLQSNELLFKELEKANPKKGEFDILLKTKFGYPHDRVTYLNDDENFETPCFYTTYQYNEKEEIYESELSEKDKEEMKRRPNIHIAFGHTPMFRLPYEKRIGDLIPLHLKKKPEIIWNSEKEEYKIYNLDYANAIFGFTGEKKKQERIKEYEINLAKSEEEKKSFIEAFKKELNSKKSIHKVLFIKRNNQWLLYGYDYRGIFVEITLDSNESLTIELNKPEKEIHKELIIEKATSKLYPKIMSSLSGRVYFTDVVDGQSTQFPEIISKVLSGPKPTTFQHYVSQKSREEKMEEVKFTSGKAIKDRIHYNSKGSSEIRGNKLYWNKYIKDSDWQAGNGDPKIQENLKKEIKDGKNKVHTIIKPTPSQTSFEGRIYFENLSEKELGALLFVLNLPEGCFHKIGMGKPIGLGTIKISSSVFLSNRKKRYSSLLNEWNQDEQKIENYMIKKYIEIFSNDILKQTGENKNHKDLWQTERLQELKVMLQKHNSEIQRKFRYMEIDRETNQYNPNTGRQKTFNEFRERPILSPPTKYIKGK